MLWDRGRVVGERGRSGRYYSIMRVYHNLFHFTAGLDYQTTTFTLTFVSLDEGTNTLCSNVPILNDRLGNEPDEAFSISVVNFSPAGQTGLNSESCVFITDDDGMRNNFHFIADSAN